MKLAKRPKVTCGAIIRKGDKILLTKRNVRPYKGYWCLPGGHIELWEKAEKAIQREVKEEIGLNFKPKFFRYYDEFLYKIKWHALVLFFTGKANGKIKTNKEVKEFKWFKEKEIKKLKLAFFHKKVLKDYFQNVQKNYS